MSVADAPLPSTVGPAVAAAPVPVIPPYTPSAGPAAPTSPRPPARPVAEGLLARSRRPLPRPDGLRQETGRRLAAAFGIAFLLCPLVEPMPSGDVHYPLWQLPIDLAAIASIVAAVAVLWRGGRNGPRWGAAAGVLMAVETIICPFVGHTPVGWWTWTQTGLSLFVLGTSAALLAAGGRTAPATRAPQR